MESLRQNDKKFGLINLLRQREIHERCNYTLPQKLHVTENFISRLGLEAELTGHSGCVNCLDWNETGEILASSSDDLKLCLWDPFRRELKSQYHTGHDGNVFSIKFMPKSNDRVLITGAGDNCVIAHDISAPGAIFHCRCHTGRVKRIACENSPHLFWSGSEDGTVMQYDLRTNHYCKPNRGDNYRVLVDLVNHAGRKAEVKCLAVNQMRPELIAVGANDEYVRLYDRRMIKLGKVPESATTIGEWARVSPETAGKGDPDNNIPIPCAQYFIPGHLRSIKYRDTLKSYAATYVTFSSDGNELLVNMGNEQIYLFDINKDNESQNYQFNDNVPKTSIDDTNCIIQKGLLNGRIFGHRYYSAGIDPIDMTDNELKKSAYGFDMNTFDLSSMNIDKLPDNIEIIKQEANCKFQENQYALAISIYNKALLYCPNSAVLYANRAAAFMKRKWVGDIYAALRDCQTTLLLDPNHVKAHFRLARCLHDISRHIEAKKVLDDFNDKFPDYSNNSSHRALRMDIKQIMSSNTPRQSSSSQPYHNLISSHEMHWRESPIDYKLRYCGHCNTSTDIKEASFFGNNGQYIVAGSDDGSFFIWDRYTTNIVRVLRGDERIVNCLQPHPLTCLLATSGIDPVIRLWGPLPEDGKENEREVSNLYEAAKANQDRMNSDPFEQMMMSMGYHVPGHIVVSVGADSEDADYTRTTNPAGCRSS